MVVCREGEIVTPIIAMGKSAKREIPKQRTPRRLSLTKNRITKVVARPASGCGLVSSSPSANVRVVVRVRPPNSKEQSDNYRTVVKVIDDSKLVFDPEEEAQGFFFHGIQQKGRDLLKKAHKAMPFAFDRVFSETNSTDDVFMESTQSLIDFLMDGCNCSVFAYGATGAGKTYTMTGTKDMPGITFLTMTELFKRQEDLKSSREFKLGITYLEVYNELVKDLLNPGPPLQLREDIKYGVTVAGIKMYNIKQANELFSLLDQGNKNRTQHPTDANAESSRSHAVFQVYIQMTMKDTGEIRTAKLSMIDLAGSERGSATGYGGARFTEGANINKSLLALGNCINGLADGLRHIPYRDSKLTRLLKDSLGGNCQTVMIANVSPSSFSYEDTYNTLKYASRAKKIKTNVKRNVVQVNLDIAQYVKKVEDLKKENMALRKQLQEERDGNLALRQRMEEEMEYNNARGNHRRNGEVRRHLDENDIDKEVLSELDMLTDSKKNYLMRHFQLVRQESGTTLRREIKQEIDARLSDIMTNSTDKEEVRSKLNRTIDRFRRQELTYKDEIDKLVHTIKEIDEKFDAFTEKHPQYKNIIALRKKEMEHLELRNKLDLEMETKEAVIRDHMEHLTLMEKMAIMLKSCYMQLKGHGLLPPVTARDYQDIVNCFQGRKTIKWDEQLDSGVSSLGSIAENTARVADDQVNMPPPCVDRPGAKRKMEDTEPDEVQVVDDGPSDKTFTQSQSPTPNDAIVQAVASSTPLAMTNKQKAQQIIAKVLGNVSPAKRLASRSARRDFVKENRVALTKRPISRSSSSDRDKFRSRKSPASVAKPKTPIKKTSRPKFKS